MLCSTTYSCSSRSQWVSPALHWPPPSHKLSQVVRTWQSCFGGSSSGCRPLYARHQKRSSQRLWHQAALFKSVTLLLTSHSLPLQRQLSSKFHYSSDSPKLRLVDFIISSFKSKLILFSLIIKFKYDSTFLERTKLECSATIFVIFFGLLIITPL